MCLTIDGIKDEISTGIFIKPENWNQELKVIQSAEITKLLSIRDLIF